MHKREIAGFIRGLLTGTLGTLAIAAAILIQTTAAFGNDSTARLEAGGIRLTKTEDIRILEEVLEISVSQIRVRYRFLNESGQDINTKVAFPLPLYNGFLASATSIAEPETILKTFKISVNDGPITTKYVRKAVRLGSYNAVTPDHDITYELRKFGFSDKEIFFEIAHENWDVFEKRTDKFIDKFGHTWAIDQTLFWDMTFPAGKEIVVEHEYAPAIGHGWTAPYQRDYKEYFKENMDKLWNSFAGKTDDEDCPDETLKRAIENRVRREVSKGATGVSVTYDSVEYILGTGRNWKGPIGEFKLRLVKYKPEQFVSLCFPGAPTKISPTVYEFVQKDYVPQDKLIVYFYTVEPK